MADPSTDGQDALRLLARAARALVEEGAVSTEGLLPAYRTVGPAGHEGAKSDAVDVAWVHRARALGGDSLLRARTLIVDASGPPRSPMRVAPATDGRTTNPNAVTLVVAATDHAAGDALALALGLSLEAAKLAHGLKAPADALRASFATPQDAKHAVDALERGGAAREIVLASSPPSAARSSLPWSVAASMAAGPLRVDPIGLALHVGDRPVYIVCGAGAFRMHDLLSPFARRLRNELFAVGQGLGAPRDDEVHAAADVVMADGEVWRERLEAERNDGFVPVGDGAVVVKCESMPDDVDRRCRESAALLKRARALLVLVEPCASSLALAIDGAGAACRAISLIHEASQACTPSWVRETASGHFAPIANAFEGQGAPSAVETVPALGLTPREHSGVVDDELFLLMQAVLTAQAAGGLAPATRIAVKCVTRGDVQALSRACTDVLSRLGPKKGR